jgi:uncharacterized Fe-S center protein
MAEVYFFDYSRGENVLSGMDQLWKQSGIQDLIPKGGSVAVKLHMGELGNITYIRPVFVRKVVELVKEAGGRPFVTDTTALYPGARDTRSKYLSTAAFNGFVEGSVGAPIVIADGDGYDGVAVKLKKTVEGCSLETVKVASGICRADFLLVLSHVKGHMMTGIGGAIKNLGMGCVTKESKREQHKMNSPILDESKCDGCEACVEACPTNAIALREGRPVRDLDRCIHCSACLFECPSGALFWEGDNKRRLQVYLAHASSGVMSRFSGRAGFINLIQDVTPYCDCAAPAGDRIVPDIGILASLDPVAVDKASLDLIDQAPIVFSQTPPDPPDRMGRLNQTESVVQFAVAQKLDMGSLDYRLIRLP